MTAGHAPMPMLRAFAATLVGQDRRRVAAYVAASLAAALSGSLAALCLVPLIQPGQALKIGGQRLEPSLGLAGNTAMFVLASAGFALLRWWVARQGAGLAAGYAVSLRRRVHAGLIQAPLTAVADASSAEIANVLTYNIEIITQGLSAFLQLSVAATTAIVSLCLACLVAPGLMLALPPLLAVGWLALRSSGHEQLRLSRQYVADMTQLFWLSEDFPRRLRHVRSFQREDAERSDYQAFSTRLGQGYRQQQELVASGRLALELAAIAAIAAILCLAGVLQGSQRTALITVSLLLGRLLPYLASTRQSVQQLRAAWPALELWQRYAGLEADRIAPAQAAPPGTARAPIRIDHLRLRPPLSGVRIGQWTLAPGELTLVCGHSGVGKSSLMDVLSGMVPAQDFAACSGGGNLDFPDYQAWARHSAYLGQGVRPWHPSVRRCLAWAAPAASQALMWQALADVGLAARLEQAGQGLDTPINGPDGRLSGGEMQRLLLAQVLLRQPVLALLDEATSALDADSEQRVLLTLRQRLPQTALVVVSHRTSLAAVADRCITLGPHPA
jgi:ATP-binding cassette subfamily C protein